MLKPLNIFTCQHCGLPSLKLSVDALDASARTSVESLLNAIFRASNPHMASGAIGDYLVSDPVRELNELQSNPSLRYKPPKREMTPGPQEQDRK